ncbi:MAG: hypothetical protein IJZ96_01155, partial [Lachnospiraceae bacterium]|nr:hypothetical protein [Lachnospiraceae bacterium]
DLRDVSDINLDIGEFELGFENELYAHNVFFTRGDMWIGKVKDGKIFFVVKKRALYNEQWTLYRIDLAEIDKIGCVDYSPEEMEVNQSIPEVVKLQDGSIRIVYDRGYVKQTIVFDIEGKIEETLSREFETGYVTNAQILDNTDELIFFQPIKNM